MKTDKTLLLFSPAQKRFFAFIVMLLIPLGSLNTDIYLPSLPAMAEYFHVLTTPIQWTVSIYILVMGPAQLIAGPVSDAYGRKKILLPAMAAQLIAVLGILFSTSVYALIACRALQGLGAGFMMVAGRAVITDIFSAEQAKKYINYLTLAYATAPIVAPFIGGYLQQYFGWQANFIAMLIYIIAATTLVAGILSETIVYRHRFSVVYILSSYYTVLNRRMFVLSALFASLLMGYIAFISITGPFLMQNTLHYSAVVYGHIALLLGLAWFLGNLLNRFLLNWDKTFKTQCALWGILLAATAMTGCAWAGIFNLTTLVAPIFVILLCGGCLFPIYITDCMMMFPKLAASANACAFCMIWLIFGIFAVIASLLKVESLLPLATAFTVVAVIMVALYYRRLHRKPTE